MRSVVVALYELRASEVFVVGHDDCGMLTVTPSAPVPRMLASGVPEDRLRVLEAARLGAARVGHGVRLADLIAGPQGAAVLQEVRERGLHLEVCPTSNVQTGAAASIAAHPIRALWRSGISLSFHTDNRLMSRTSASREAALLVAEAGFGWDDLQQMSLQAAQASFLPPSTRYQAQALVNAWPLPQRHSLCC
jgi:adenosine deaminase